MKTWFAATRPEERRRREQEGPGWADTVPAWFRSEAFAEDLLELASVQATSARPGEPCIRPPAYDELPASVATAD